MNLWLLPPGITQITLKYAVNDIFGDLLLLAFTSLAYPTLWEYVTTGSQLRHQGVWFIPTQ
jgi:hypothetical protein